MTNISKYLIANYGFDEVPCSVPLNVFEDSKLYIYVNIKKVSLTIFRFLMKLFPIKRLKERPDGSVWLQKYLSCGICEVEVFDTTKELYNRCDTSQIKIRIYYTNINICAEITGKYEESVEKLFSLIPELQTLVRQKKINELTELN